MIGVKLQSLNTLCSSLQAYRVRVVKCNLCTKPLCVCMLQSKGRRLPFAPASSVCAIWSPGRKDVLWLAWHPCWYASRGCPGRLPVLCLLLHECSDRCRWNRKSNLFSEARITLNAVNPLLFSSQFTSDERPLHYGSTIAFLYYWTTYWWFFSFL